eukprot:14040574-Alexandrium_andersonii.AAC.1
MWSWCTRPSSGAVDHPVVLFFRVYAWGPRALATAPPCMRSRDQCADVRACSGGLCKSMRSGRCTRIACLATCVVGLQ